MTAAVESQPNPQNAGRDGVIPPWAWFLGGSYTLGAPLLTIAAFFALGQQPWVLLYLPLHITVLIPLIDKLVGRRRANPSPESLAALNDDRRFAYAVYGLVGVGYVSFIVLMAFLVSQSLPLWAALGALIGAGIGNGTLITVGHELGHKANRADRWFGKLALSVIGYGHFTADHNLSHHRHVSTPVDHASAQMGESVYRFALRELPGCFVSGWRIESERLIKRDLPVWSIRHNDILQCYAITLVVALALVLWLGIAVLPFILIHHALAWFALTMVNYVEHYGLLREKRENGRYAPCEPKHSWNTDHAFSNLIQVHLQRHSDHHANPMRPYQSLLTYDDVPQLPSGYPGAITLAAMPPLWFRVMDKKVMDWAKGDLARVNVFEPARARLESRWGS